MNLFIVGWNLQEADHSRVATELRRMTEIYPQLDAGTIWHRRSTSGSVFSASMHTADRAAAPRQYVKADDNQVVFYSGLPVNSVDTFLAHRAEELSTHWDQLTENLDGMFCIVRINNRHSQIELLTDIVGMEQVFYFRKDSLWLISNSVYLIEQIVGNINLDPSGISLILSMGWVGGDRTLLSNIRVVPGGQLWTWIEGNNKPSQHSYYKRSILSSQPRKKLTTSYFKGLTDKLTTNIRVIGNNFDDIICALTGGRDTRLVASLALKAGIEAQYYTFGEKSGTDGKIAKNIADKLALNYRLVEITASDVTKNWDNNCRQVVLQGDGMGFVDLIPAMLSNQYLYSGRLTIDLGGTGCEVSRAAMDKTMDFGFFFQKQDASTIQGKIFSKHIKSYGGIISEEATEVGRAYINQFVEQYLDEGFDPVDIPNAFFLFSRVRRKRGCNKRVQMQYQDFYSPSISRAYFEAAFAMSALQRFAEPMHYHIVKLVSPELHKVPFDKYPWYYPDPILNFAHSYLKGKIIRKFHNRISNVNKMRNRPEKVTAKTHQTTNMFDQKSWFEATRNNIRELCLDNHGSIIWDVVNRSEFEKITSPSSEPAELSKYGPYIELCFKMATLFHYENRNNHS